MNNLSSILAIYEGSNGDATKALYAQLEQLGPAGIVPTGQVSFHTEVRGEGPDYLSKWDGVRGAGPTRICRWCEQLLVGAKVPA